VRSKTYIDAARQGKNTWLRYLLGILLILFFWWGIGGAVSSILAFTLSGSTDPAAPPSLGAVQRYLAISATFWFFLVGIVIAMALIHRRSLRTLVTPRNRINKKRIFQGFGVWFSLMGLFSLLSFILDPSIYSLGADPAEFIPFALVALILTPIQTTAEELFFRGYLLQAASFISKKLVFLVTVSGVLTMLAHVGSPEMGAGFVLLALYYLAVGVFLALISLKDGTTELAIGIHAATNLFIALVISYSDVRVGGIPSLLHTNHFDPLSDVAVFLGACAAFYVVIFMVLKARYGTSGRPGVG
jgi:membrane protease YdiL (CAAX protease family)